jgi:hypothetical protein
MAKTMLNDAMLDLETWGTRPGSMIRSIGALMFDPYTEKVGAEFYVNVDEKSQEALGLTKDPGTVAWWEKQSQRARDALLVDQQPIDLALSAFCTWFRGARGMFVWSQGGNFDEPLLAACLHAAKITQPWKFWDSRCTRTAYSVAGFNSRSVKREGTYHNALDDARHQAICVQRAYAKITNGRLS